MRRRHWLCAAGSVLLGAPAAGVARQATAALLAAAWDDDAGHHHAGWLGVAGGGLQVTHSIELPTRAHGLLPQPDGSLLVVSRRPGQWMLRWQPGRPVQWQWSEPARRFCGHVLAADAVLFTTETDVDSGAGLLVKRDGRSLARLAEWPTHGSDPHAMLVDADGSLLVANGGVPSQPERGRVKLALEQMDSSLVRLEARSGEVRGQWRLDDQRLSLRHLARHPSGTVGVALQAEHDDVDARLGASLLALFDGTDLRLAEQPRPLAGYGGDIVATERGFVVAATRAAGLADWNVQGHWQGFTELDEACALARDAQGRVWAAGRGAIRRGGHDHPAAGLRFDNHWALARR